MVIDFPPHALLKGRIDVKAIALGSLVLLIGAATRSFVPILRRLKVTLINGHLQAGAHRCRGD